MADRIKPGSNKRIALVCFSTISSTTGCRVMGLLRKNTECLWINWYDPPCPCALYRLSDSEIQRENMLTRPVVELVNKLHWLGRRLAVLKRLYQSYELIMWRLLQRQRLLRDEARSNRPPPPFTVGATFGDSDFAESRQPTLQSSLSCISNNDTSVGVQLSSPATARFERLLDRNKLYCLSEIEACLVEKESLTFLVSSFFQLRSPSIDLIRC